MSDHLVLNGEDLKTFTFIRDYTNSFYRQRFNQEGCVQKHNSAQLCSILLELEEDLDVKL